mmetsp:Transcript_55144/g.129466  ORF Transcript_55144/g.129466 Transcript_55144/m.129466 type:complete len:218 (+) Transcript_55144:860-1513(+)
MTHRPLCHRRKCGASAPRAWAWARKLYRDRLRSRRSPACKQRGMQPLIWKHHVDKQRIRIQDSMASLAVAVAAAKHIGEPLQLQVFGRSALLLEAPREGSSHAPAATRARFPGIRIQVNLHVGTAVRTWNVMLRPLLPPSSHQLPVPEYTVLNSRSSSTKCVKGMPKKVLSSWRAANIPQHPLRRANTVRKASQRHSAGIFQWRRSRSLCQTRCLHS